MEGDIARLLNESIERMNQVAERNMKLAKKLENYMGQMDREESTCKRVQLIPDPSKQKKYSPVCIRIQLKRN